MKLSGQGNRSYMFAIFGVFAMTFLVVCPGTAQTASDSLEVNLVAWDSVMGQGPFEHPGGPTSRICVISSERGGDRLTESKLAELADRLAQTKEVTVHAECKGVAASSFGSWILEEGGKPAVLVDFHQPVFPEPDAATVLLIETRAGRWARDVECTVVRDGSSAEWTAKSCVVKRVSNE